MLTQEEIQRLDKLLEQLRVWTKELEELLSDKERIVGCNCDEVACVCNKPDPPEEE